MQNVVWYLTEYADSKINDCKFIKLTLLVYYLQSFSWNTLNFIWKNFNYFVQ